MIKKYLPKTITPIEKNLFNICYKDSISRGEMVQLNLEDKDLEDIIYYNICRKCRGRLVLEFNFTKHYDYDMNYEFLWCIFVCVCFTC